MPAGTNLATLILDLHTDKRYWGDDADKFMPERFLPENIKKVNKSAYIPFAIGPRMCIGHRLSQRVLKVFLCHFLRKYRLTTSLNYDELEKQMIFTLHLKQGFMVKVERR